MHEAVTERRVRTPPDCQGSAGIPRKTKADRPRTGSAPRASPHPTGGSGVSRGPPRSNMCRLCVKIKVSFHPRVRLFGTGPCSLQRCPVPARDCMSPTRAAPWPVLTALSQERGGVSVTETPAHRSAPGCPRALSTPSPDSGAQRPSNLGPCGRDSSRGLAPKQTFTFLLNAFIEA